MQMFPHYDAQHRHVGVYWCTVLLWFHQQLAFFTFTASDMGLDEITTKEQCNNLRVYSKTCLLTESRVVTPHN